MQVRSSNSKSKPSAYLEAFLSLRCNTDLQILEVFPNIKEITESMAMATACWKLELDRKRDDVTVVAVGDGCTPRTGALLAHMTKWNVVSVDPKLRVDAKYASVKRLSLVATKIEDARSLHFLTHGNNVVLLACHSHASLQTSVDKILEAIPLALGVVSMECCNADNLPVKPDVQYVDKNVWSPKNLVRVWHMRSPMFWMNTKVRS